MLKIFGLLILTESDLRSTTNEIRIEAENKAVRDLVDLLRQTDKIYLEPVTMGENATIRNCTFLGNGMVRVIKEANVTD